MPDLEDPTKLVEAGWAAVRYAESVRRLHRRRSPKGARQREADLGLARDRLRGAMRPLKSIIGKYQYAPQTSVAQRNRAALIEVSQAIQAERRKVWKMMQRAG
jgi:hypothetical protein